MKDTDLALDIKENPTRAQEKPITKELNHLNINEIYDLLTQANFGEKHAIAILAIANLQTFSIEHTRTDLLPRCSELVKKAYQHIRLIKYQEKIDLATEILSRISENDDDKEDEGGDDDDDDDEDQEKLYYLAALKEEMPPIIGKTEDIREFLGC